MIRRFPKASVSFAMCLALAGCRNRGATPDGAGTTENAAGVGSSTGGASNAAASAPPASHAERVTLHTDDGWTLVGDLTLGAPSRPVVVLLHQLSSNRSEWAPFVTQLHALVAGYPTLAIDARGHGESTQGPDGVTRWQQFGSDSTRWDGLRRDLAAAISYLRGQHLDTNGFILVGSSIGSTAALRAAASEPAVRALVMLSPGIDYRGLDTLEPMARYAASQRPVFLVAGDGDTGSAEAVRTLAARARSIEAHGTDAGQGSSTDAVRDVVLAGTGAHGVSMTAPGVHPALWTEITAWLDAMTAGPAHTIGRPEFAPAEPAPQRP